MATAEQYSGKNATFIREGCTIDIFTNELATTPIDCHICTTNNFIYGSTFVGVQNICDLR